MIPTQPLEIERRTDTRQMAERLRGIPHLLAGDCDLLGEHAQVVRVGEDIVEVREGEFPEVGDGHVVFGGLVWSPLLSS